MVCPGLPEPDFRALFESAPGLYLVLDHDLRIIAVSNSYLAATMTTREKVLGKGIFDVFPDNPNDTASTGVKNLSESLNNVLKNRAPDAMAVQKYDIPRPEGEGGGFEERYWSPMNSPVMGADGSIAYIIHRVEDVTEYVRLRQFGSEQEKLSTELRDRAERMEAEVYLRAKQVEEANRKRLEAVGQLAGGVAHDFNNLLSVVLGYARLAMDKAPDNGALCDDLSHIQSAAESAAALTHQLLAYTRQQVLERRVVSLNTIVEKMMPLLKPLVGDNVELRVELDSALGRVKADPGQLEQVIMNLALNARDAMPDGGRLTLRTANEIVSEDNGSSLAAGEYATLIVRDTGIGIDNAIKDRIFEPFFTTKSRARGTGLGLATVQGIVKQSGGGVSVESAPGRGTAFTIRLKRTQEAFEAPIPIDSGKPIHGSETILLVEDQPMLRELTQTVLRLHGYNVVGAETPAAALRKMRKSGPFDLLLTDVIMPGMNGRALADQLRTDTPNLKVLFTSGYTDDAVLSHGELPPGTSFLPKPFTPEALLRKLRNVLDQPSAGEEKKLRRM